MIIRKANRSDLDEMQRIFAHARSEMAKNGNPTQWKNNRPPLFLIERDIYNDVTYVIEEDDRIVATFSYTLGVEPTYIKIEDGKWLNDLPYGTIHRIASDNTVPGIFEKVIEFVSSFGYDIRIDTHKDNKIMLHVLEKTGFIRCGNIIIDDGTERIAFQKLVSPKDTDPLVSLLSIHSKRYPLMQSADAVKIIYQNEFGSGHMIKNKEESLEYLKREYSGVTPDTRMRIYEDVGNNILRVNLASVKNESELIDLNDKFYEASIVCKGSIESFKEKIERVTDNFEKIGFSFTLDEFKAYIKDYAEKGYPPVSHSPMYKEAYSPAYRIIRV